MESTAAEVSTLLLPLHCAVFEREYIFAIDTFSALRFSSDVRSVRKRGKIGRNSCGGDTTKTTGQEEDCIRKRTAFRLFSTPGWALAASSLYCIAADEIRANRSRPRASTQRRAQSLTSSPNCIRNACTYVHKLVG